MTVYTTNTSAPMTVLQNGNVTLGQVSGGPFGSSGVLRAPGGVITEENSVTEQDLESEVFNTPIEALVNLWQTRYGNNWVDLAEVMDDRFYARVFKRLRSMGMLESHYLTDRARFVCRKPE